MCVCVYVSLQVEQLAQIYGNTSISQRYKHLDIKDASSLCTHPPVTLPFMLIRLVRSHIFRAQRGTKVPIKWDLYHGKYILLLTTTTLLDRQKFWKPPCPPGGQAQCRIQTNSVGSGGITKQFFFFWGIVGALKTSLHQR